MGAVGIEVRVKDLEAVSTKVKLLNNQIWFLEEGFAVKYCYLFEHGRKVPVQVDRLSVEEIFPKIRFIFDKKNQVIAERACPGTRLRTTRKNKWLSAKTVSGNKRALYFYQMIQRIEDTEYAKQMLAHYYSKK